MFQTRSAVLTMLQNRAREERIVHRWPPPFSHAMTPYAAEDFEQEVRRACSTSVKILRVSKVVLLGDLAVGKTSLVRRFCQDAYSTSYKPTIGVDFELERFDILGVPFNLQIWDTAGQERFRAIAASYYRSASAIVVVFDLASAISLSHCAQWLAEARRCNPGSHFVFLVGAKRDLVSRETYSIIETRARIVARDLGAEYWAVSAKRDNGVREFFTRVAALCFDAAMLKETQQRVESIPIGSSLIGLKRQEEKKESKNLLKILKCPF